MNSNPETAPESGNLFDGVPDTPLKDEQFDILYAQRNLKIERILSTGQRTADGEWYDQAEDEWVVLLSGAARLFIEGEAQDRSLQPGDWILLPAHCRHRVTWTQQHPVTTWLAVHVTPQR
ncbi:MAG: cupin domain-containing protein [Alphaproteobacteria bacterium]|nr:cupin domain-containing protein [Alphaproteobacteria bacterium]